jgi:hypothetical protein
MDLYYGTFSENYSDVVEQLNASTFLAVEGTATTRVGPLQRSMSGEFDGTFRLFNRDPRCCPTSPWSPPIAVVCTGIHEIELSR